MSDKTTRLGGNDPQRIDPAEPLPGWREPSGRWATPFQTQLNGGLVWTVALRMGHRLSTREALAGCASQLYAETPEALVVLTRAHDQLAETVRNLPLAWSGTSPAVPDDDREGDA
ncbi:hypothetical protein [Actinomadura keratinilytica]|uniref:Uncharacterized protein n=1 Tax=Actinomadura keratinilytica TaxID=547461 RepID=A0ABP7YDL0_9ACTN